MKHTLLLTAIVSVLTTSAFASNIVTSKTYVDNRDNLKVDIAQGVGTNNANVGKTLVVNSSGNLELGTPSAGNYVEDSITDGVTNKAPSENAVHDALADKQDTIPAKATASEYSSASLVEATGTPGTVGERKIWDALVDWDNDEEGEESFVNAADTTDPSSIEVDYIPTVGAVIDAIDATTYWMQERIGRSGYTNYHGTSLGDFDAGFRNSWLNDLVKGTGLVTKTSNDYEVGERKIFEASDVSGYHTTGLTQIQKDIQDISIPTVGAMMTAISNNQVTLPTGTAGNVVTYNAQGNIGGSVATYDGSGTYNAGTDAGKIATAAAVNTRQAKKTCAGWPDGVEHTDANCWLWNMPD